MYIVFSNSIKHLPLQVGSLLDLLPDLFRKHFARNVYAPVFALLVGTELTCLLSASLGRGASLCLLMRFSAPTSLNCELLFKNVSGPLKSQLLDRI